MSTKHITVKYIDTGEERIWVWDGELLEAANEYKRRVELWADAALVIMDSWDEPNEYGVRDYETHRASEDDEE